MKYSHVFWDWNGTLLDDVDWCLGVLNGMLQKRGLPVLESVERYREVFGFPVSDYYRRVGFDFDAEPFEALAEEYMALYLGDDTGGCGLHTGAEAALGQVKEAGATQLILTASKRENLCSQMAPFAIGGYFDELLATEDIFARGKAQVGLRYVERNRIDRGVLVGDTLHDFEVAQALGLDCLLLARGHHGRTVLAGCGAPVLDGLEELWEWL